VWQVTWSHPQFGTLLASCGYDRRVLVQREVSPGQWMRILSWEEHASSVNSVGWAPHEYGLQLAAASSDGRVSVLTHRGGYRGVALAQRTALGCGESVVYCRTAGTRRKRRPHGTCFSHAVWRCSTRSRAPQTTTPGHPPSLTTAPWESTRWRGRPPGTWEVRIQRFDYFAAVTARCCGLRDHASLGAGFVGMCGRVLLRRVPLQIVTRGRWRTSPAPSFA
jgi:hypothetical protein